MSPHKLRVVVSTGRLLNARTSDGRLAERRGQPALRLPRLRVSRCARCTHHTPLLDPYMPDPSRLPVRPQNSHLSLRTASPGCVLRATKGKEGRRIHSMGGLIHSPVRGPARHLLPGHLPSRTWLILLLDSRLGEQEGSFRHLLLVYGRDSWVQRQSVESLVHSPQPQYRIHRARGAVRGSAHTAQQRPV